MYAIKTGDTWSEWQTSNTFTGLTHNTEYIIKTRTTDIAGNASESQELTVKTDELLLGNLILKSVSLIFTYETEGRQYQD